MDGDDDVLVIGSLFRQRGGFVTRPLNDPELEHEAIQQVIGQLATEPDWKASRMVFPNVPAKQVAAITSAFSRAIVRRAGTWFEYAVDGATSVDEFVASLNRKKRALWQDKRSRLAKLGWWPTVTAVTGTLVERAAPLLADVNLRNGTPDDPRLARARVLMWWRSLPDAARAITVTDAGGNLVAVCMARVCGNVLELQEVGIDSAALGTSDAYVMATVLGPLEYAFSERINMISAGYGHADIKSMHGASPSADYHVIADLRDIR